MGKDWGEFIKKQKEQDLSTIITDEKLKLEETQKFINNTFCDWTLKTTGTDIDKILPLVSRFGGGRGKKEKVIIEKLLKFFEKYFDL